MTYIRVLGIMMGLVSFAPALVAGAAEQVVAFTMDAADLDDRGVLAGLRYRSDRDAISLDDMLLMEDDAPGNGPPEGVDDRAWFEKLSAGIRIRKEFILDDPRARAVWLVFDGTEKENNDVPLHIAVNGVHVVRPPTKVAYPLAEHYYLINDNNYFTDNWFVVELPVGALVAGRNEIELWSDAEEPAWEVVVADAREFKRGSVDRTEHPDRSAKSRDGGRTWDYCRLGWKDELDGEYAVRLSLDRSVPSGIYTSPVIDVAVARGPVGIKRLLKVRECALSWDVDVPDGSAARISVRFSDNPVPDGEGWSAYQAVGGFELVENTPPGRFMQFRVEMTAGNPLVTPELRGLSVRSRVDVPDRRPDVSIRLDRFENGRVVRSSFPFTHEDFAKLRDLRERFDLDELTAGCATEFEKQLRLLRLAYRIPINRFDPYDWSYERMPVEKRDESGALVMLDEYDGRRRDLHCLCSNFTLMGFCLAMGYPARYVNLQTEGRKHAHEVMEVWSNDFDKWVIMDATRDYYYYDPATGVPLSLTEVNERLAGVVPEPATWRNPIWKQLPDFTRTLAADVAFREGDNRFSILEPKHGPHLLLMTGQLHMVTRNDFASRPWLVPWRMSGHWAGNQYLGWYSDTFPRKREYGMNTDRRQDFDPPLNQAGLTVLETDDPRTLRVDIDTVTPCLDGIEVNADGSEWLDVDGTRWFWPLHEGRNELKVRVRNTAGVHGPVSTVTVLVNS